MARTTGARASASILKSSWNLALVDIFSEVAFGGVGGVQAWCRSEAPSGAELIGALSHT